MAHGVSDPPPTAPLSRFSLLVRVREAAPGTSWPKKTPLSIRQNDKIAPWAHSGRFWIIFISFVADRKNMFFPTGAKIYNIDE